MKKYNIKKIITSIVVATSIIMSIGMAIIGATRQSTWLDSPAVQLNTWSERTRAVQCYEAAETAQGSSAYIMFDTATFGTLQSNFADSSGVAGKANNRIIRVDLMELDETGGDDLVKVYMGNFVGKTLNSITLNSPRISGDIEGKGDNVAELYGEMYIYRINGDPATAWVSSGLFRFKVGMN